MTHSSPTYPNRQLTALVVLRMLIGWHLLYEGLTKLWNPNWSAAGYLNDSGGIFKGMFEAMASSPGLMEVVNFLNVWGLIFIGLGLLLGFATRWATIAGIALLGLYFLSHPPLIGVKYALPSEGSYLWVNKNLIEVAALVVILLFPTSHIVGLDRFFGKKRAGQPVSQQAETPEKVTA